MGDEFAGLRVSGLAVRADGSAVSEYDVVCAFTRASAAAEVELFPFAGAVGSADCASGDTKSVFSAMMSGSGRF